MVSGQGKLTLFIALISSYISALFMRCRNEFVLMGVFEKISGAGVKDFQRINIHIYIHLPTFHHSFEKKNCVNLTEFKLVLKEKIYFMFHYLFDFMFLRGTHFILFIK